MAVTICIVRNFCSHSIHRSRTVCALVTELIDSIHGICATCSTVRHAAKTSYFHRLQPSCVVSVRIKVLFTFRKVNHSDKCCYWRHATQLLCRQLVVMHVCKLLLYIIVWLKCNEGISRFVSQCKGIQQLSLSCSLSTQILTLIVATLHMYVHR